MRITFGRRKRKKRIIKDLSFILTQTGDQVSNEVTGDTLQNQALLIIKDHQPIQISRVAEKLGETNKMTMRLLFQLKKRGLVSVKSNRVEGFD